MIDLFYTPRTWVSREYLTCNSGCCKIDRCEHGPFVFTIVLLLPPDLNLQGSKPQWQPWQQCPINQGKNAFKKRKVTQAMTSFEPTLTCNLAVPPHSPDSRGGALFNNVVQSGHSGISQVTLGSCQFGLGQGFCC